MQVRGPKAAQQNLLVARGAKQRVDERRALVEEILPVEVAMPIFATGDGAFHNVGLRAASKPTRPRAVFDLRRSGQVRSDSLAVRIIGSWRAETPAGRGVGGGKLSSVLHA